MVTHAHCTLKKKKSYLSCCISDSMVVIRAGAEAKLTLMCNILTHLNLASYLLDIGKQNSPRCDAAERGVPSGAILFA